MATVEEVAAEYRRAVIAREVYAADRMTVLYAGIVERLTKQVAAVNKEVAAKRDPVTGEVPQGVLIRLARFKALLQQAEMELLAAAQKAAEEVVALQEEAIVQAQLSMVAYNALPEVPDRGGFDVLPVAALARMVGVTEAGPLEALLTGRAGVYADAVKAVLIDAIVGGWGAQETAAALRRESGKSLTNALTIARTETLRAYRGASLEQFKTSGVVRRWQWFTNLDPKACAYCWSQHGGTFPLDEPMATHPNCRCTPLPVIPSMDPMDDGTTEFDRLSPGKQLGILGPAKFRAYKAGAITLGQLAGKRTDPDWGRVGYERSLSDVLGTQAASTFLRP